jgi:hypothetical protein
VTRSRRSRASLWLLLAAALIMRAFVPQGYMPARSDSGTITVRVCGSGHVVQIPLGRGEAPDKAERAQPPCAFAGLGSPALPPPAFAELAAPPPVAAAFAPVGPDASSVVAPRRLPPARGPPLPA